jgi:hypothetical protein
MVRNWLSYQLNELVNEGTAMDGSRITTRTTLGTGLVAGASAQTGGASFYGLQ